MGEKVISNIMEKKNLLSTWNRAKKWLKQTRGGRSRNLIRTGNCPEKEEKEEKVGKRRAEREQAVGIADENPNRK